MEEKEYKVYELIFPDGMKYVGLTHLTIEKRAGSNGRRYVRHPFYPKIQEAGWDNVEKRYVKTDLTKQEARALEKETIAKNMSEGISLNKTQGGECGSLAELYEYKGNIYNAEELVSMSEVEGLTVGDISVRINHHGWSVERAITQPKNVKVQPFGLGERKYLYKGNYYNSYELVQMSNVEGLGISDITCRINKHGWDVERAITQPKKKMFQKYFYKGNYYTTVELAELSPISEINCHIVNERIKLGWDIEKCLTTPIKHPNK